MKRLVFIIFVFIYGVLFPLGWSNNSIYKFSYDSSIGYSGIIDYSDITIASNGIIPENPTNAWLKSEMIDIGDEYIIDNIFVNFIKTDPSSYLILSLRDSETDLEITNCIFSELDSIILNNIFIKKFYIFIEPFGTDIKILSFGLERRDEYVIKDDGISLFTNQILSSPPLVFYKESGLEIEFDLKIPSNIDMMIFNDDGRIITYLSKREYFEEGLNTVIWRPEKTDIKDLKSGVFFLYFKFDSIDDKTLELTKRFMFVKD